MILGSTAARAGAALRDRLTRARRRCWTGSARDRLARALSSPACARRSTPRSRRWPRRPLMSNAESAAIMFVSARTVKFHVSNVLGKLGVPWLMSATSAAMSSAPAIIHATTRRRSRRRPRTVGSWPSPASWWLSVPEVGHMLLRRVVAQPQALPASASARSSKPRKIASAQPSSVISSATPATSEPTTAGMCGHVTMGVAPEDGQLLAMIYVFAVIFTRALGTWMWWRSTPDMWWYVDAVAVVMGVGPGEMRRSGTRRPPRPVPRTTTGPELGAGRRHCGDSASRPSRLRAVTGCGI